MTTSIYFLKRGKKMIKIVQKGNLNATKTFLTNASKMKIRDILERYAKEGVRALSEATPVNTGKTSDSWDYELQKTKNGYSIYWTNSNINNGVPIAVILQYGHGTNGGGYVQGVDYINPALKPIFDKLADNAWKEVTSK